MYKYLGIKYYDNLGYTYCVVDEDFSEPIKHDSLFLSYITILDKVIEVYKEKKLNVVINLTLAYKNIIEGALVWNNNRLETKEEVLEYLQTTYPIYCKDMEKYLLLL
jgi:hypothetical protein